MIVWITTAILVPLVGILSLCQWSGKIKFHVKYTLYFVGLALISVYVFLISLPWGRNVKNASFYFTPAKVLCWLLGIQLEMRGMKNIPADTGGVVVCNHGSFLDILLFISSCLPDMIGLAHMDNLTKYVPVGLATWMCGHIFINSENHESAMRSMKKCEEAIQNKKQKVIMFPEGRISRDPVSFAPFKKGAFHLAIKAQSPVIPMVISPYHSYFSDRDKKFESGKSILTCLPPVSTIGLTSDDVDELLTKVRGQMLEVYTAKS